MERDLHFLFETHDILFFSKERFSEFLTRLLKIEKVKQLESIADIYKFIKRAMQSG